MTVFGMKTQSMCKVIKIPSSHLNFCQKCLVTSDYEALLYFKMTFNQLLISQILSVWLSAGSCEEFDDSQSYHILLLYFSTVAQCRFRARYLASIIHNVDTTLRHEQSTSTSGKIYFRPTLDQTYCRQYLNQTYCRPT